MHLQCKGRLGMPHIGLSGRLTAVTEETFRLDDNLMAPHAPNFTGPW